MTTNTGFELMIQGPDETGLQQCVGLSGGPLRSPVRIEFIADQPAQPLAQRLAGLLRQQVGADNRRWTSCRCDAEMIGASCRAWDDQSIRNVLVVVTTDDSPSAPIRREIERWINADHDVYSVMRVDAEPEHVLPPQLVGRLALRYEESIGEVIEEILDAVYLASEERRAFISYAHADGFETATQVFRALSEARYDVYLDRFRTRPPTDFGDRINDELIDKAMIVVVETAGAGRSRWVRQEIDAAHTNGYGVLGVLVDDLDAARPHDKIDDLERLRLPSLTPEDCERLVEQVNAVYRRAVQRQRERADDALRTALSAEVGTRPDVHLLEDGGDLIVQTPTHRYRAAASYRTAGVREGRALEERRREKETPVLHSPAPVRTDRRHDMRWLSAQTDVSFIPHGVVLLGSRLIARGEW
ncbi:MAG: toll/interleukin-1 receptor domain-containing protein [Actinomycetota bacterium]